MKKIIAFLVSSLFLTPVSAQYLNIKSRYKPLTYEEIARPVIQAQQAFDRTVEQINDLYDYIVDVLGHDIDNQLRQEMNQELKLLDIVESDLFETGHVGNAKVGYNYIYRNIQSEVAAYNNRLAQARERKVAEERARKVAEGRAKTEYSSSGYDRNNDNISRSGNANSTRIITNPGGFKPKGAGDLFVNSITLTPTETILDCSYKNPLRDGTMNISRDAYVQVVVGGDKYKLLKTEGIAFAPDYTSFSYPNQTLTFKLYFPAIPTDAKTLDFVESLESPWRIYGLKLK